MNKLFNLVINLVLILTVNCNVANAQKIVKGEIIDSKKAPIPFATIIIIDSSSNSKILKTDVADENGRFKISIDNDSIVNSGYIYAKFFNTQSNKYLLPDSSLTIILSNSINLAEITVLKNESSLERRADRFVFIPSPAIKEGASILDVLKISPLINYDLKSDLFSIINKENSTVIINNRKSIFPKDMIVSFLRSTSAKNIINIEIITNPGSEYSANTTGGIININLKKNIDEGLSGNIVVTNEQSILNTSVVNGSLNYRNKKIGIRLFPVINRSFNYKTYKNSVEGLSGNLENTDSKYKRRYLVKGGGFGLDYDIDDRNLFGINGFVSIVNGNAKQSNKTLYSTGVTIDSSYLSPISGRDKYLYNFGNVFFEHKVDSTGAKKVIVNFDYNQFTKNNTDDGSFQKIAGGELYTNPYKNIFSQNFYNQSLNIDYSSQINVKNKNSIGAQISNTNINNYVKYLLYDRFDSDYKINPETSNHFKYSEIYFALYLTKTMVLNEKLNASLGLRLEGTNYRSKNLTNRYKIDSNYVNLFPTISLSYKFSDNQNLSLTLSEKIKRPTFEQLQPGKIYINPGFFNENNPFLQPVKTYNADAMVTLRNKYFISFGYNYSVKQYEQFVIPVQNGNETYQKRTYINFGNSSNSYIEFYTRQSLFGNKAEVNLSAIMNYNSYYDHSGYINNRVINNLNYTFLMNDVIYISREKKLLAFTILRYNSPIKDIFFERSNVLFKTDLGVKKTFNSLNISFYVSDIFNSYGKSVIHYRGNTSLLNNKFNQNTYTRSISLSLNYNFGNNKIKEIRNKRSANEELRNRLN